MQEIDECQKLSLGPNFITFLSQRYGYRPFPSEINQADFDLLLSKTDKSDQTLLRKWFALDSNRVPAQYVLQPITVHLPDFLNNEKPDKRAEARKLWWDAFEAMTKSLRKAARTAFADDQAKLLPYVFSVTENEIRRGLLQVCVLGVFGEIVVVCV